MNATVNINNLLCTLRCSTFEFFPELIEDLSSSSYSGPTIIADLKVINGFRPSQLNSFLNNTPEEVLTRLPALLVRLLKRTYRNVQQIRVLLLRCADLCGCSRIFSAAFSELVSGAEKKFLPSLLEICVSRADPVINLLLSMVFSELAIHCNAPIKSPILFTHCLYSMLLSQREIFADANSFAQNLRGEAAGSTAKSNDPNELDFTAMRLYSLAKFLRNPALAALFISGIYIDDQKSDGNSQQIDRTKIEALLSGDMSSICQFTSGFPVSINMFACLLSATYSHDSLEVVSAELASLEKSINTFYNGYAPSLIENTQCLTAFCDMVHNLCVASVPDLNNVGSSSALGSSSGTTLHAPVLYMTLLNAWIVAEIILTTSSVNKFTQPTEAVVNPSEIAEETKEDNKEEQQKKENKIISLNGPAKNEFLRAGLITLAVKILRSPYATRKNKIVRITCKFLTAMCAFPESLPAMLVSGLSSTLTKYDALTASVVCTPDSTSEMVHQSLAVKKLSETIGKHMDNVTDLSSYLAELKSDILDMTPLRTVSLSQIGDVTASQAQTSTGVTTISGTLAAAAEGFWKSNANKFIENDYALLRRLISIGNAAILREDAVTVCAALHDLGAFASSHPNGREIISRVEGAKKLAAEAMQIKLKNKASQQMLREMSVMALSKMVVGEWNKVFETQPAASKSINTGSKMALF